MKLLLYSIFGGVIIFCLLCILLLCFSFISLDSKFSFIPVILSWLIAYPMYLLSFVNIMRDCGDADLISQKLFCFGVNFIGSVIIYSAIVYFVTLMKQKWFESKSEN